MRSDKVPEKGSNELLVILRIFAGVVFTIAFLGFLYVMFILWVVFSTSRDDLYLFYTLVIGATLYVLVIRQCFLGYKFRKRVVFVFGGIIVVMVIAWGVTVQYHRHIDRIPVFAENMVSDNLSRFQPFGENSLVAVLPQTSTLALHGDLPKMDCALALYPVVAAFVKATYNEEAVGHDNSLFRFSTSPVAYNNLIAGETDILLATLPSAEQVEAARTAGVELKFTPIGKEAFVFFVNKQNRVDDLTVAQLQDIYGGKIKNWRQVGGKNGDIMAFQRNPGSGSQNTLEKFMEGRPLMSPPRNETIGGMGGIVSHVANYKNFKDALGFSFRYFVQEIMGDDQVKMLRINGVYPDKASIRDGSYPLAYEFYAVTRADNLNPNIDRLIDWMLSPQGQYLIEASGYVPIGDAWIEQQ